MDVLEKLLRDLHGGVDGHRGAVDLSSVIASAESLALGDLEDNDAAVCAALLFSSQSPPSLLQFMTSTLRMKDRDVIRAKVHALKLMAAFIKRQPDSVQPYGNSVVGELIDVFKKEESGEVKAALLLPFKNIMRKRILIGGESLVETDQSTAPRAEDIIPLDSMFTALTEEIKYNKKLSKGTHCESLIALGILVAVYPTSQHTLAAIEGILDLCDQALRSSFNIKIKGPDFPVMAGAFSCLDKCLYHFEGRYVDNSELWTFLLQAAQTTTSEDVSRYTAARKAIKLIKHHSELFVGLIGLNAEKSYEIVHTAHRSGKEALLKHSEGAIQAIVAALAAYLLRCKGQEGGMATQMVGRLLTGFLATLRDLNALTSDQLALALQGLNSVSIAVPLVSVLANESIPVVIDRVVEVADHFGRFLASTASSEPVSDESADVAPSSRFPSAFVVYRKSLFFSTVVSLLFTAMLRSHDQHRDPVQSAALLAVLRNSRLLGFLEETGTQVLVGYVRLYRKQQRFAQAAVARLFALHVIINQSPSPSVTIGEALLDLDTVVMNLLQVLLLRTISRAEPGEKVSPDLQTLSAYNVHTLEDRLVFIYSSLWFAFLAPVEKSYTMLLVEHLGPQVLGTVRAALLGFLLGQGVRLMNTLQLAHVSSEEQSGTNDAKLLQIPLNLVDQDLLINLVAFLEVVLKQFSQQEVLTHLTDALTSLVELSERYRMVSGFYRLITALLRCSEGSLLMGILIGDMPAELSAALRGLCDYVLRLQANISGSPADFTGELLARILKMVLAIPIELLSIRSVMPMLYLSLVNNIFVSDAVQMLTRYYIHNREEFVANALSLIPLLNRYIVESEWQKPGSDVTSAASTRKKSRSASIAPTNRNATSSSGGRKLSQEILVFLGRLGQYNRFVLPSTEESTLKALRWSLEAQVCMSVHIRQGPVASRSVEVLLDSLLPLVASIASRSVDLNDLVADSKGNPVDAVQHIAAAAETLHNIVILMLGSSSLQQNSRSVKYSYGDIYARLFPVIFVLASSGSAAYAAIFERLLHQLVRHFSSGSMGTTEQDSALLVDSLVTTISDHDNSNVKDLCATAVAEYIKSAISSNVQAFGCEGPTVNINLVDSAMSNICVLLSHPQESKRRAGMLILLKAYRHIRAEVVLVKRYAMYLLFLLVKLLDNPLLTESASKEVASLCVKFEEMLVYYGVKHRSSAELHIYQEHRAFPRSLNELADWLWQHVVGLHSHKLFRRYAMRFFISSATLLYHSSSATEGCSASAVVKNVSKSMLRVLQYLSDWASTLSKSIGGPTDFFAQINRRVNPRLALAQQHFQTQVDSPLLGAEEDDERHGELFLSALDVYNWLVTMCMVSPAQVLQSIDEHHDEASGTCRIAHALRTVIALVHALKDRDRPALVDEMWFRVIVFVHNLVMFSGDAHHEVVAVLRTSQVYGWQLRELAFELVTGVASSTIARADLFKAASNLLEDLLELEPSPATLQLYVSERAQAALRALLLLPSVSSSTYGTHSQHVLLLQLLKARALHYAAFPRGATEAGLRLVVKVSTLLADGAKDPVTAPGKDILRDMLAIAMEMGVPLFSKQTAAVRVELSEKSVELEDASLVGILAHRVLGPALAKRYRPVVARFVLSKGSACSVFDPNNMRFLFEHAADAKVALFLEQILLLCSEAILEEDGRSELTAFLADMLAPELRSMDIRSLPEPVVSMLLTLFAQSSVLRNAWIDVPALRSFVLKACEQAFQTSNDVSVLLTRLKWLPLVVAGGASSAPRPLSLVQDSPAELEQIVDSLHELVARKFPLDSTMLNHASELGKEYLKLLEAYLAAVEATGCCQLLLPLLPSLREGSGHIYQKLFSSTLQRFAAGVSLANLAAAGLEALGERELASVDPSMFQEVRYACNFCLQQVYDPYQDQAIKRIFFEQLFVPIVSRLSSCQLVLLFSYPSDQGLKIAAVEAAKSSAASSKSIIKVLYELVSAELLPVALDPENLGAHVYLQTCAYRLFALLYDNCLVRDVKALLTCAFVNNTMVGGTPVTGKELTQSICKTAFKLTRTNFAAIPNIHALGVDMSTESGPAAGLGDLIQELYGAAYCCLATVVSKTQSEEAFFDNFIFKAKPAEELWTQIILHNRAAGACKAFAVFTPKFESVALCNNICRSFAADSVGRPHLDRVGRASKLAIMARLGAGRGGFLSQYISSSMVSSSQAFNTGGGGAPPARQAAIATVADSEYSVSQYVLDDTALTVGGDERAYNLESLPRSTDLAAQLVAGWDDQIIYFEMNDVNSTFIMATLTRVIQRMHCLFKDKWMANLHAPPTWLGELCSKLNSSANTVRVNKLKLFVLRMLMNQPVATIIAPWMSFVLPSVLESSVALLIPLDPVRSSDKPTGYHYFLRDLVFTICDSWRAAQVPCTCHSQCSILVNYIIASIADMVAQKDASDDGTEAEADIIRESTLSLCALLRLWFSPTGEVGLAPPSGSFIQLDLGPLLSMISAAAGYSGGSHARQSSAGSLAVRSRLAGLQIMLCVLEIGYPILFDVRYLSVGGSTDGLVSRLMAAVLDGIKFPRKEVAELSSQVCGKLLSIIHVFKRANKAHYLHRDCTNYYQLAHEAVESKAVAKDGMEQVVSCLKHVTLSFPRFLKKESVLRVSMSFNTLSSKAKFQFLEALLYFDSVFITDDNTSGGPPPESSVLCIELLRPNLRALLTDLTSFAFGRGSSPLRLPAVQLYTILLLTKFVQAMPEINSSVSNASGCRVDQLCRDVLEGIMGVSETEGLRFCFGSSSVLALRFAAYHFLVTVYKQRAYIFEPSEQLTGAEPPLLQAVVRLLLAGLSDRDGDISSLSGNGGGANPLETITVASVKQYTTAALWAASSAGRMSVRQLVYNFFHQHYGLSEDLHQRTLALFTHLFDVGNVANWVKYTSFLLLSNIMEQEDNHGLIFTHNLLENHRYTTFLASSGANSAHGSGLSSTTPMFALERTSQAVASLLTQSPGKVDEALLDTLLTQSHRVNLHKYTQSAGRAQSYIASFDPGRLVNYARGTQQFSWTQTQDAATAADARSDVGAGRGGAYGTFMGESATIDNVGLIASQQFSQLGSSVQQSQNAPSSQLPLGSMAPPAPRYVTTQRVPLRFSTRGPGQRVASGIISKVAFKRSIQRDEEAKRNAIRISNLELHNRYRVGDLPDLAISNLSILRPLQALALSDTELASEVIRTLVRSLCHATPATGETKGFVSRLVNGIHHILLECQRSAKSSAAVPLALSLLLEICQHPEHVATCHSVVPDSLVADLALHAGCLYIGLQLLERKLLVVDNIAYLTGEAPSPPAPATPAKKKRATRGSVEGVGSAASRQDSASALFDRMASSDGGPDSVSLGPCSGGVSGGGGSHPLHTIGRTQIYLQLLRVYDRLQEDDITLALSQSICETVGPQADKSTDIKEALDLETRGDILQAIDIYSNIVQACSMDAGVESKPGKRSLSATSSDQAQAQDFVDLLLDRSVECYRKLADWKGLHETLRPLFGEDGTAWRDGGGLFVAGVKRGADGTPLPGKSIKDHILTATHRDRGALQARMLPQYFGALLHVSNDATNEDMDSDQVRRALAAHAASPEARRHASPIDLAAAFVVQKDFIKASQCLDEAYDAFLAKYTLLHPIAHKAKARLLLSLQRLNELQDVVMLSTQQAYISQRLRLLSGGADHQGLLERDLLQMWSMAEPDLEDPLHHYSDLQLVRTHALQAFGGDRGLSPAAIAHLSGLVLRSAEAAVLQGNLSLVKQLLEQNSALCKKGLGKKATISLAEVRVVVQYNRTSIVRQGEQADVRRMFGRTLELLHRKEGLLQAATPGPASTLEQSELQIIHSQWLRFGRSCGSDGQSAECIHRALGAVRGLEVTVFGSGHSRATALRAAAYDHLAQICDELLREREAAPTSDAASTVTNEVLEVAQEVFGRSWQAGTGEVEALRSLTAQSLLRGLALQSQFCSERVLRLVQVLAKSAQPGPTEQAIVAQLLAVPPWLYLRFVAQLMGSLDLPEGRFIVHIMEHVARAYPFALHYVYRITRENNSNIRAGKRYGALRTALENTDVDRLVEALMSLTHPELRYSDYVKVLDSLLKHWVPQKSEVLQAQVLAVLDDLFAFTLAQAWPVVGEKIGRYNKHFAKQMLPKVQAVLGGSRQGIFKEGVVEKLKALGAKASGAMQFTSGKAALADFSEWLADFDSSNCRLEVPGQYGNYMHRPPDPSAHDLVSSALPQVVVMSSIRKPKKLCLVGHTGRVVPFLAKGGEDLRNDERIEQLFALMNQLVRQPRGAGLVPQGDVPHGDAKAEVRPASAQDRRLPTLPASQRHRERTNDLRARTYVVVPMSSKVGLLEWVPHTVPLQAVLAEEMARDPHTARANPQAVRVDEQGRRVTTLSALKGCALRTTWLGGNEVKHYHRMYKAAAQSDACDVFAATSADVPTYFLQQRLLALSSTPEAFHAMRRAFLQSLAVNNVFGYVLGIGDRHLDNLMMDATTGEVVYIDFGICFGMGASVLPVPEFMPMRLTAQLVGVSAPLQGLRLLRQCMLVALGRLRADQSLGQPGLLANALEVYINDPVMDWLKGAASAMDRGMLLQQREELLQGTTAESLDAASLPSTAAASSLLWEPMRRIQGALRKTRGEDPVELLMEDLQANVFVQKLGTLDSLRAILEGCRRLAPRSIAKGRDKGPDGSVARGRGRDRTSERIRPTLSPEEQVDLLVAMSTDPNVLVRQWVGLQPWL